MSARSYAENRLVTPTGFLLMISLPVNLLTGQFFYRLKNITDWLKIFYHVISPSSDKETQFDYKIYFIYSMNL